MASILMLAGCRPAEQAAQPAPQAAQPAPQRQSEQHLQPGPQRPSESQPPVEQVVQPPSPPWPEEQAPESPLATTAPLAAVPPPPASGPPEPGSDPLSPLPLPVVTTAPVCYATPAGSAATADSYKHEVACHIHARNGGLLYEGAPPPVLRSIVVLSLRIDAAGRPVRIGVVRSNGIRALERRAIQSVRAAAPLPLPAARMLRRGSTDIVETWLFRDDGRFQVRTLAMVQAASGY